MQRQSRHTHHHSYHATYQLFVPPNLIFGESDLFFCLRQLDDPGVRMLVARRPPGCWREPFFLDFSLFLSFCQGTLLATFGFLGCFFSWLGFGNDLHCSGHRGLRPLIPVLRQVRAGCTGFDGEDRCSPAPVWGGVPSGGLCGGAVGCPAVRDGRRCTTTRAPLSPGGPYFASPLLRCFLSLACLWRGR